MKPNYKKIFNDILEFKYPEKRALCFTILNKCELSYTDIVNLNNLIFNDDSQETKKINANYKVYDEKTIFKILKYQKDHHLNNLETASQFKLSRNTLMNWQKNVNTNNFIDLKDEQK